MMDLAQHEICGLSENKNIDILEYFKLGGAVLMGVGLASGWPWSPISAACDLLLLLLHPLQASLHLHTVHIIHVSSAHNAQCAQRKCTHMCAACAVQKMQLVSTLQL